jgi:hypothetical protein
LAATLLALAVPTPAFAVVSSPNDPFFPPSTNWTTRIGWTPADSDVAYPTIAIVDSGLWSGFDDFAGYLEGESADCTAPNGVARPMGRAADVDDVEATLHGTKVATLAAAPANGKGSVGVSPNSPLLVVRYTLHNDRFAVVCAFNYLAKIAEDGDLLVVNVSSAFDRAPPNAQKALDRLIKAGALVVAAAGNRNGGKVQWPANAPHVLAVGRDDGAGARGGALDLVAPGAHLRLPDVDGQWTGADAGTSFSAPIVSGAAARVWGPVPVENPQVITYLLRKYARKTTARDGFGLVNIATALAGAKKVPTIEDVEPNDRQSIAQTKTGCARTCKLRGLVTTTDDKFDYWRLRGRGTCPAPSRLKATRGVKARCVRRSGRGGGTFVVVQAKARLGLYTVTVPRR